MALKQFNKKYIAVTIGDIEGIGVHLIIKEFLNKKINNFILITNITIFKKKADMKLRKSFKRFPSISALTKVKEFTPSRGSVIFFQSTPNSYHGVTLFREEKGKKRFFIYGSYALSKPVV